MSIFSTTMQDRINNYIYHATAMPAPPATMYLALFATDPGQSGTGTELTGNGYARQVITTNASSGGTITNSADIAFPQATADWTTAVYAATFDAAGGGTMYNHGKLPTAMAVKKGQIARFAAGALSLTP